VDGDAVDPQGVVGLGEVDVDEVEFGGVGDAGAV
jgi:hypothetical protein